MSLPTILPTYNPADYVPPPRGLFPSLRIAPTKRPGTYRVYLSTALARALGLRANQPADLLPPSAGHPYWHFDLRPAATNRVRWYADTRPRLHDVELPAATVGAAESLTLCLVPGDPAFPGFFPMLPDAFFAPKQA